MHICTINNNNNWQKHTKKIQKNKQQKQTNTKYKQKSTNRTDNKNNIKQQTTANI